MTTKHHPDGFGTSCNYIVTLSNYNFAHLCKYSTLTFTHMNSQLILFKFYFELFFCCWQLGQRWECVPIPWNFFTSMFSICIWPLRELFSYFNFKETRVGRGGVKQGKSKPHSLFGGAGQDTQFYLWYSWTERQFTFPLSEQSSEQGPRIFKLKWPCCHH